MAMDWLKIKSSIKTKQNYIHTPQAAVKINLLLDPKKVTYASATGRSLNSFSKMFIQTSLLVLCGLNR